ncbi:hypothetical protein AP1_0451 [Aeromonas phage AP1]|nr:hypothetical protein AP1_0451 [Aeromonas phage AP1]
MFLNMGGAKHPVKVDDKQVYLGESEVLNGVTIGKVIFHPACESIMSKETEIFKVIRKLTAARLYQVVQPVAQVIFAVAGKKSGKTLNGKLVERSVAWCHHGADKPCARCFGAMVSALPYNPYTKRSAVPGLFYGSTFAEPIGQSILKTKHRIGSASTKGYVVSSQDKDYITTDEAGDYLYFNEKILNEESALWVNYRKWFKTNSYKFGVVREVNECVNKLLSSDVGTAFRSK